MDDVAEALAAGEPLDLLALTSSFLTAFDPRVTRYPFGRDDEMALPTREGLVESFLDAPLVETSALLTAIAALTGDDLLRSRVRREVAARGHVLPRWLLELEHAAPGERVVEMRDVLGDGENLLFGVTLPSGHALSAVVYVDHNLGTVVKDAFVLSAAVSTVLERMRAATSDPDVSLTELDPADARTRITDAIDHGALVFPPLETDTWPACRPLVEWALRHLPAGGRGYERPEWSKADRQALAERFLASPFAHGLDDADTRDLLDQVLWFGTDFGPGDPLRWSPVAVEILLSDWIPRKIVADVAYLARAPELLRALIRFSHAERGIRAERTEETLAAVDEWEPEYQHAIRTPRLQGPDALLAAMGAVDPTEFLGRMELEDLLESVGGKQALDGLGTAPLPDEPFAWERVPAVVRERVAEVLRLVDEGCAALLDLEYRTAARRLLARLAEADPRVVGRGRAQTTAASICWIVAKANDRFEDGDLQVKDLLGFFGVAANTPSQRGKALLNVIGAEQGLYGQVHLGSTDYLTSGHRRRLVELRDRLVGR
jgi:hypothetical protein